MNAYVIIGRPGTGKSSVTRCLTGSGSGKIRTRPISTTDPHNPSINVYVHLTSLQEDYKRIANPADFVLQVGQENCDAVLFSLWPHGRGGDNERPDADTYLRHFVDVAGWNIVKVACLGSSAEITATLSSGATHDPFPTVDPAPANTVAAQVREHFGWV